MTRTHARSPRIPRGPRAVALALVAVTAALAATSSGCASSPEKPASPAVSAAAASTSRSPQGQNLYDLPEMRRARGHREVGARMLESAYLIKDPVRREHGFNDAWLELKQAEEAYHDALAVAPSRFRPVIDHEIEQVAQYMRQIQRDRGAPVAD